MTLKIDSETGVKTNLDFIIRFFSILLVGVAAMLIAFSIPLVRHTSKGDPQRNSNPVLTAPSSPDSSTPPELPPWLEGLPEGYVAASDPHDAKWSATVKRLNREEPDVACAACGGTDAINWHHVDAWHNCKGKNEWKRYDRSNLIPLCNSPVRKCHWIFGHLGVSWSAINPHVREHAAEHLKAVEAARVEMAEVKAKGKSKGDSEK